VLHIWVPLQRGVVPSSQLVACVLVVLEALFAALKEALGVRHRVDELRLRDARAHCEGRRRRLQRRQVRVEE